MTELNLRIEQALNGFTIHVSYVNEEDKLIYYDLISNSYKEALSLVKGLGD